MPLDYRLSFSEEEARRMAADFPLLEAELRRRNEHIARLESEARRLETIFNERAHPLVRSDAAARLLVKRAVEAALPRPAERDFRSVLAWTATRNVLVARVAAQVRLAVLRAYRSSTRRPRPIYRGPSRSPARVGTTKRCRRRYSRRSARAAGRPRPGDEPDPAGAAP
jgi:hypothetical protein